MPSTMTNKRSMHVATATSISIAALFLSSGTAARSLSNTGAPKNLAGCPWDISTFTIGMCVGGKCPLSYPCPWEGVSKRWDVDESVVEATQLTEDIFHGTQSILT